MKKTLQFIAFLSLVFSLLLTSCGPSKKLLVSQSEVDKLQKDIAYSNSQLNDCNVQVKNLNDEKTSLLNEKASLLNENAAAQNYLKALNTESKMAIADQAKRLKNLQDIIQSQKNIMYKLKNSLANALMNYTNEELSVNIKDGNVFVLLQEKLLFRSGSDVVDSRGKEALKLLAQVLNNTSDVNVMIEGHTDNVPIKTKQYQDNWDLSTARATSIVRILTVDNGFDATRISAAGRGKFHPLFTNETLEGRAGNRRTEIILSPDMRELYKLLEQ